MSVSELVDVMEERRRGRDALGFMTRAWRPQASYVDRPLAPKQLKQEVLDSMYIQAVIREVSSETGESEDAVRARVQKILEEMGIDRKMYVVRALGVAFIRTALAMRVSVYVNERRIFQLKSAMGDCPVLFLPTHRSYADFCLMTYLCYHYDISLPAVAAGMDFYKMAGMGKIMRETCAFYIPRSLAGERLKSAVLRRYVRALVARNPAPLEFFIEGARSRSNKSLHPKYGLLSMSLLPYFSREVPDVMVVPISINYDRIVEQTLFTYEHLGVPKPRETTKGLLRTLSFLKDDFGDMYIRLGAPLLASAACRAPARASAAPLELRRPDEDEARAVRMLADRAVAIQQELTIMSTYNLISTVLLLSVYERRALDKGELAAGERWLIQVLESLNVQIGHKDIERQTGRALHVHRHRVRDDGRLRLLCEPAPIARSITAGHRLSPATIQTAVAMIELMLYVNPVAVRLAPAMFVRASVPDGGSVTRERLHGKYMEMRTIHKYEFFYCEEIAEEEFSAALDWCVTRGLVSSEPTGFSRGAGEQKLVLLLDIIFCISVDALLAIIHVAKEQGQCEQQKLIALAQRHLETLKPSPHPYCYSREALRNLILGLKLYGALSQTEGEKKEVLYGVCEGELRAVETVMSRARPDVLLDLDNNPVILKRVASLL